MKKFSSPHERSISNVTNTFFFVVVVVFFAFDVQTIPKQFSHHLPDDSVPAILFCGDKMWEVHYCYHKDYKYFKRRGWKAFVVDNYMRVGDGCVFELMDQKKMHFKVQILRGDAPALPGEGGDGRSSRDPILID